MGSSLVFQSASRGRFVFLMALALILAASSTGQSGTLAYFIATATSGGAILLLRCTSDVAATTPLACNTVNVYVTQVYPTAGAGTQVRILTAGGLAAAVVGPVSTTAGNFSVTAGTGSFTGGQLAIGTAFNMGGPDAVTGADGQVKGLIFGHSDYLASIVYLPTQMGNTLAGLSSTLSFTWSAEQRVGIAR